MLADAGELKFNRSMWIFIGALVVMMLVVPVLNFFARTRR
jgi:hypothetical protein